MIHIHPYTQTQTHITKWIDIFTFPTNARRTTPTFVYAVCKRFLVATSDQQMPSHTCKTTQEPAKSSPTDTHCNLVTDMVTVTVTVI